MGGPFGSAEGRIPEGGTIIVVYPGYIFEMYISYKNVYQKIIHT